MKPIYILKWYNFTIKPFYLNVIQLLKRLYRRTTWYNLVQLGTTVYNRKTPPVVHCTTGTTDVQPYKKLITNTLNAIYSGCTYNRNPPVFPWTIFFSALFPKCPKTRFSTNRFFAVTKCLLLANPHNKLVEIGTIIATYNSIFTAYKQGAYTGGPNSRSTTSKLKAKNR